MNKLSEILYVMGSSQGDIRDLKQAIVLAKESQASMTILDTIDSLPRSARMLVTSMPTADIKNTVVARRAAALQELLTTLRPDDITIRIQVRFGKRAKEIVGETAVNGYDVVIKYPDKGRTDDYLARHCKCPVQLLSQEDYMAAGHGLVSRIIRRLGMHKKRRGALGLRPGTQSFAG